MLDTCEFNLKVKNSELVSIKEEEVKGLRENLDIKKIVLPFKKSFWLN